MISDKFIVIYRLILAFLILCFPIRSNSQQIEWTTNKVTLDIGRYIAILKHTENLKKDEVLNGRYNREFRPAKHSVIHLGFTTSTYWFKFSFRNITNDSLWLELDHAFIPEVTLYYQNNPGIWDSIRGGYKISLTSKLIKQHQQVFPLLKGEHEYYLRIIPLVHPITIKVSEYKSFLLKENRTKVFYGIYIGLLLFAVILNFYLFIGFKKVYYLQYAILIILYMFSSAAVMEGYIIYFLPETDLMHWYKVVPVLDMPALLLYCSVFLKLKIYNQQLYILTTIISVLLIVYAFLLEFIPLFPALISNYILALLTFILAIYIGIYTQRKGNKLGYYFVTAYSLWFILLLMEVLYILLGTPRHIFDLSYVSIAIFVESFLLAFLLVKRFQWEKKEDELLKSQLQTNLFQIKQKFDQEIFKTRLEIKEQTFHDISQEIHDNIGQVLSFIKLNLNTIQSVLPQEDEARINESKLLISNVMRDLRDIAKAMNTDFIKAVGLSGAIEQQLDTLRKSGIFIINFDVSGKETKFNTNKELFLFRIIQEVLNNIVKHANASTIDILIEFKEKELVLHITDNGIGFDLKSMHKSTSMGIGLHNIMDRIKLIYGHITIDSLSGKGTKIKIIVPSDVNQT